MTFFQKVIFALVLTTPVLTAFAEERGVVRGVVVDSMTGAPLEFANVAATDKNGILCHLCASDASGEFVLAIKKKGGYTIKLSYVGYKLWEREIHFNGESIDLGKIALTPEPSQIEASSITSKSLIKRESDRIIYDVSADPEAATISMTTMMAKIPGLIESTKDGKLAYKDESLGKILIDDVNHPMINKLRQYPMRFIRADHMSKIELILPGSPEYANDKPMVVIRMAKPLPYGLASEISGYTSTINDHKIIPDIVINTPLVGVGIRYDFAFADQPNLNSITERQAFDPTSGETTSSLKSTKDTDTKSLSHNIDMDLFRSFLDNKLLINASVLTQYSDNSTLTEVLSVNEVNSESTQHTSHTLSESISRPTINGGLSANYRWGNGKSLSANCTFKNISNISSSLHDTGEKDTGYSDNSEVNAGATLSTSGNFKFGRISNSVSGGAMFRRYDQETIYSGYGKDEMTYSQNIFYLYESLSWYPSSKFSLAIRMHLEDVLNSGLHKADDSRLDYHDINFIPLVTLRYKPFKKLSSSTTYYTRVRRPSSEQLSIAANTSDSDNLIVGNPTLTGERTHFISNTGTYRLGGGLHKTLSYEISYETTPNAIEMLSAVNAGNVRTSSFANIGSRKRFSSSVGGSFYLSNGLSISANFTLSNRYYSIKGGHSNEYWSWLSRAGIGYNFKFFTLSSNLNLYPYNNQAQSLDQKHDAIWAIGISRFFPKQNFGFSISGIDLLHGRSSYKSYATGDPSFLQELREQRLGRYLRIDLRYSFGRFTQHTTVAHTSYDRE